MKNKVILAVGAHPDDIDFQKYIAELEKICQNGTHLEATAQAFLSSKIVA